MAKGNTLGPRVISAEPLHEANGYCPICHNVAHFRMDKELGYLKQCPRCGNIEYLHRKILKFDKHSRQWR